MILIESLHLAIIVLHDDVALCRNAYEASEVPLSVFMAFGMPKVEMTLSSTYIAESYLIISGCLQFSSVILNK